MVAMDRCKLSLDLPKVIIAPPTDSNWWVQERVLARVELESHMAEIE